MDKKNISQQIQILLNQFSIKNYDHVISKGNILLKKNPEYVILYNLIGSAYQNNGDYINAKSKFENGLKLDPNNLALLNNLGLSHKNLLEYDSAEKLFLKTGWKPEYNWKTLLNEMYNNDIQHILKNKNGGIR